MCGLVGHLGAGDLPKAEAASSRRLDDQGPRSSRPRCGAVLGRGPVALGHRRLSILDLSPAGAQPMHSACGRYVIAFNGEIYNHHELGKSLHSANPRPLGAATRIPRPCLLASSTGGWPRHWSARKGCLPSRSGTARRALSLARDRMGEKPLYWGWAGVILFSALNSRRCVCILAIRETSAARRSRSTCVLLMSQPRARSIQVSISWSLAPCSPSVASLPSKPSRPALASRRPLREP